MLNVGELATWAGWIMTIVGLMAFVIRPVMSNFTKITENLTKMTHSLDLLNRDLEASKSDRVAIHDELKRQDERLDKHSEKLVEHGEQLKSLWKKEGNKNGFEFLAGVFSTSDCRSVFSSGIFDQVNARICSSGQWLYSIDCYCLRSDSRSNHQWINCGSDCLWGG
jgi:hypothetical protein